MNRQKRLRDRPRRYKDDEIGTSNINKSDVTTEKFSSVSMKISKTVTLEQGSPTRKTIVTSSDLGPRTRSSSKTRLVSNASKVTTKTPIAPIIEESLPENHSSLPTTLTTNTSTRAPNKLLNTTSVQSARIVTTTTTSSTSEKVDSESGGEILNVDSIRKRLSDRLRRSLTRTEKSDSREGTLTPTTERGSRSVTRSFNECKISSKSYSDDDDDDEELENEFQSFRAETPLMSSCRKVEPPKEFGGWIGAILLMLLIPALVYYLVWICGDVQNRCALKPIPLSASTLLDLFHSVHSFCTQQLNVIAAYVAFQLTVFLLVAILPGRQIRLDRLTYNFNGVGVGLAVLLMIGALEYIQYRPTNFVLDQYFNFLAFSIISAFLSAAWSYFSVDTSKTTMMNEYGQTGNFVVDYALGRQINPKWMLGHVDWKQCWYRFSLITTLLIASCFAYQTVQWPSARPLESEQQFIEVVQYFMSNVRYNSLTLLSSIMLFIYVFDSLLFEHHLSSSFELQHEGFGCLLLLRYSVTPYLLSAVTKYSYEQQLTCSCSMLYYSSIALLIIGLMIKRYSCAFKYQYRRNSQNPLFTNIETIHTYQGSRLLLSGLWGYLRQPNYLGDIIAITALGIPLAPKFAWPPMISLLILMIGLLHRATRTNARNQNRYHSSWHRYRLRVPYYVLPKIF